MIKVGLTGGIGSGKSTVARFWNTLGIPIYESDSRAKALMNSSSEIICAIKELFGKQAYDDNGLNRQLLSSKVFSDSSLLDRLNAIVHPAVQKDFLEWSAAQSAPYVIEESAILFECGASKVMDFNVVVCAKLETRLQRAASRDNVAIEKIMARVNNQMSQESMKALADFEIETNTQLIIPQVIEIDRIITSKMNK